MLLLFWIHNVIGFGVIKITECYNYSDGQIGNEKYQEMRIRILELKREYRITDSLLMHERTH